MIVSNVVPDLEEIIKRVFSFLTSANIFSTTEGTTESTKINLGQFAPKEAIALAPALLPPTQTNKM